MENWKPVPGFEGWYEVSDHGNIRSLDRIVPYKDGRKRRYRGKMLTPRANADGYLQVQLSVTDKPKTVKVHRVVAEAFIQNPHGLPEVNHKDENKTNNAASNLEWCSHKYNSGYGTRGERIAKKRGKPLEAYASGEAAAPLRFNSLSQAAEHFDVSVETVRQALKYGWKCSGHILKFIDH